MDECKAMNILMESRSLVRLRLELDSLPNTLLLPVANKCFEHFTLANYAGFIGNILSLCVPPSNIFGELIMNQFLRYAVEPKFDSYPCLERPVCGKYAMEEEIDKDLSFGYNAPYKFARLKLYLWLAKTVLVECCHRIEKSFMKDSLTCRLVLLWQDLLKEPAVELRSILNALEDVRTDCASVTAATEALLERMYAHLLYNQVDRAKFCLNGALTIIGLKIKIIGVLGKRTRFQEKFMAQLVARAVSCDILEDDDELENDSTLPLNVLLRDDALLENICFAETDASTCSAKLSALSLACMLASGMLERKMQSTEDLVIEKCCSYLNEIIAQRKNWAVQASALLQRSEFEKISMRRVERACMQMESLSKLVNSVGNKEMNEDTLRKRLKLLLASGMKPFWYVDLLHAEILRSIGCTAEALIIFEKQENWDSVIDCYQSLGQLEKAERLVRDLLSKNENDATYWCLLGDILHEPSAYEKAIEASNDRSFRAHRSLGLLMLQRKHYDISYRHLKRSLELQPINSSAWFNFGYCAWKLEKLREAAQAYRECVRYEPAHFQAWNNLAAVYVRLNDLERAKAVLQDDIFRVSEPNEALKLNFEHIKLRENYMLLCIRTHDLSSAISTFHLILDSDSQYKDDAVLEALAHKLIALREENEESAKLLINKMCELLGRITSQQTSSSTIWRCYAELKRPNSQSSVTDYEFYVKLLDRTFRTCYNKQNWYGNVDLCVIVLNAAKKLEESRKILLEMKNVEDAIVKSEIRVNLRPIIATIEKTYGVDATDSSSACLKESLLKMMSSNETPTTSATMAITSTATVVSALPITVQAAAHNSPAFVNMSVGELLQKQRRIAVVTMPTSRSVTASPMGMGNRFPIKPILRHSLTDSTVSRPPSFSLGLFSVSFHTLLVRRCDITGTSDTMPDKLC
uniref:TPR_REGION domain-containing protein n=1 Tax=Elaeophora elaphi TaxID=1147741 RepID=A0A0R3S0Z9_9BILA